MSFHKYYLKNIVQPSIPKKQRSEFKKFLKLYLALLDNSPAKRPYRCINEIIHQWRCADPLSANLSKKHFPAVKEMLRDSPIPIPDTKIQEVIFSLGVMSLENRSKAISKNDPEEELSKQIKIRKKRLQLLNKLEPISCLDDFSFFPDIEGKWQDEEKLYDAILEEWEKRKLEFKKNNNIAERGSFKKYYWNDKTSNHFASAVNILKPYYPKADTRLPKPSEFKQADVYNKIAEILKLVWPILWPENSKDIAGQIKQLHWRAEGWK